MTVIEWTLREAEVEMIEGNSDECYAMIKEYRELRKKMKAPMDYADDMANWILDENKWNRRSSAQEY